MIRFVWIVIAIALFVAGCNRANSLVLPPVKLMVGDEWWGVVNTYYLRLNATIGNDEEVRAILRRGDLVRIGQIRSHYDATTSQWASYYFVSNINGSGWVKEDYINIYNYQQMAFDAQKQMTID